MVPATLFPVFGASERSPLISVPDNQCFVYEYAAVRIILGGKDTIFIYCIICLFVTIFIFLKNREGYYTVCDIYIYIFFDLPCNVILD